uniref:Cationic amino acid transporter C-terminal domain-containing protein n=1 Tax=Brassica oleracea var. oleracea TaxID=109376 RepID=A0A0D3A6X3_BRAOL
MEQTEEYVNGKLKNKYGNALALRDEYFAVDDDDGADRGVLRSFCSSDTQLAKKLTAVDLVAIGVGTTIGAGVYILVGTVARQHTGPALAVSFFIAGVAAALSACCYAELASCCPSSGSAYHYAYIFLEKGMY